MFGDKLDMNDRKRKEVRMFYLQTYMHEWIELP